MSTLPQSEDHMVHHIGWLRAAVLGANDGLVSTASLVVGAMSMAAGEYVSVSSQTDAEQADIARESRELRETHEAELDDLTRIYVARGLDDGLARQVAIQLTEKDDARLLWLRANRTPWKPICWELGISRAPANRRWQ